MEFNHVHQWHSHPVGHSQGRERSPSRCVLDTGHSRKRRGRNSDARIFTHATGSDANRYASTHSDPDRYASADSDPDRHAAATDSNSDRHAQTDSDSGTDANAASERKPNSDSDCGQHLLCSADRERLEQRAINCFGLADDQSCR